MSKLTDADAALEQQVSDNTNAIAALTTRVAGLEARPITAAEITADQVVNALRAMLLGTTSQPMPTGSGGTTTTPNPTGTVVGGVVDSNTYPLTMPANVPPAGPVVLGTGPDTLDLLVSNSPGQPIPCEFNVILTRPDGSQQGIAGPLTVSSYVGQNPTGAQHFSLKGPWGSNPKITIAPAAEGSGVNGMFVMGAAVNLVPMGIWGKVNFSGGDPSGAFWTYNSDNEPMTLLLPGNAPPAGSVSQVPTATPTPINGSTLDKLALAGDVTLPGGHFTATALLPGTNVTGAGMDETIIDSTGLRITQDKAVLLAGGPKRSVISDLTVRGGSTSNGNNGAGVRDNGDGIGFDLLRVRSTGNQDGVLTFGSDINITASKIHENGAAGTQRTHNVYVGGNMQLGADGVTWTPATNTFNITDTDTWGCLDVHEVKSRAFNTISKRCNHTTGGNGAGYEIPDGGNVQISDGSITLPSNAQDRRFIAYGMELKRNGAGLTVTITNELFTDLTGQGGIIQSGDPTAKLVLVGCSYKGVVKPVLDGWGSVEGDIAKAA